MKNRVLLLTPLALILILSGYILTRQSGPQKLLSPGLESFRSLETNPTSILTPIKSGPTPTPIKFYYDRTTNLKNELETINPQVENQNFDELIEVIQSL